MLGPTLLREEGQPTMGLVDEHGERRMEGTRIAAHLCMAIAEIHPEHAPPETWEWVAEADRAFMRRLTTWERTGSAADKEALRSAYRTLLAAWRSTARQAA